MMLDSKILHHLQRKTIVSLFGNRLLALTTVVLLLLPGRTMAQVASESPPDIVLDYFSIALEQNPGLQAYGSRIDAQQQRVRQSGSLPDPEVNIGFFINPAVDTQFLGRFSVSAMQMFPWFGSLSAAREEQRKLTDAERELYQAEALDLMQNVHTLWLEYAELTETIRLVEQEKSLLSQLETQIRARYETARARQVDLLYVEMEQERLITRIENLNDSRRPLQIRFNNLLNRDPDADIEVPESPRFRELIAEREELITLSRTNSPELKSLEAGYSALSSAQDRNRRMGYPEFGLGLEVMGRDFSTMTMMDNMNEAFIGMATVRVPLWRGKYDGRRDEYRAQQRGLSYEMEARELDIRSQLEQDLTEYREAGREISLIEERIIPRYERMYRLVMEAYGSGTADFNELIQLRRELLNARIELLGARFRSEQALAAAEREAAVYLSLIN